MAGRQCSRPAIFFDPARRVTCGNRRHGAPHPFSPDIPMLGLPGGRGICALPNIEREDDMAESVYKVIELPGL